MTTTEEINARVLNSTTDDDEENQAIHDSAVVSPSKPTPPSSWWSKHRVVIVSAALLVVALAVGLSVGFTTNKNKTGGSKAAVETTNQQQPGNNGGNNNNNPASFAASSTLPSFGEQTLVPYSSCDAFTADLTKALEILVNNSIDGDSQWFYHSDFTNGGCIACNRPFNYELAATGAEGDNAGGATSNTRDVSSFGTNNQVSGVDEADIVKSNGVHVFAVYGSEIVVVDPSTTTVVSRTAIPSPNISDYYPGVDFAALNQTRGGGSGGSDGNVGVSSSLKAADSFLPYNNWGCSNSIQSLLLTGTRLVAIASQSCYYYSEDYTPPRAALSDPLTTVVFVYDISSASNGTPLTLISRTTVQGYYSDARSIDSNAHIVTNSYIDSYTNLLQYVSVYSIVNETNNYTEAQFRAKAQAEAQKIIPRFVTQLVGELQNATGTTSCENLIRLTLMQTSQGQTQPALGFTGNGVLNTLTMVTSFDIDQTSTTSFVKSTAGLFQPTGGWVLYANAVRVIVLGQGWNERPNGGWWEETYLLSFRLNGATVQAEAVGQVPGYVKDQFSIDATDTHVRIFSSSLAQWGLVDGYWNQTSESSNQLYVLQIPAAGSTNRVFSTVGSIENISLSETIQSVRFIGNKAFISTFKYTDPFFSFDLSDPTAPELVGELNVTGFSSYLQPIANGTQLIAVGQEADVTTGWTTGLKINLFDVSVLASPRLLQSYTLPTTNSSYAWSSSDAQFDHKALRYLEVPKLLIIPVQVVDYAFNNSFDGFVVYKVDGTTGISPSFTIQHGNNSDILYGCWSSAYLQSRSLVFSGNVLTLKGHTVENHNLDTFQQVGSIIDLDQNVNRTQCYGYIAY